MNIQEQLSAYSEEVRLRILLIIYHSEVCVNCLVDILKLPQSTISRHLGTLRRANLIIAERKGQNTYYTTNLNKGDEGKMNHELLQVYYANLKDTAPYKSDREQLIRQKGICVVECQITDKPECA